MVTSNELWGGLEFASSAICWNAAGSCSGDGSPYDACMTANIDDKGRSGASDRSAVLHPISRYLGTITTNSTIVSGFTGVPLGYSNGTEDIVYTKASKQHESIGIEPGCVDPDDGTFAYAPLRLREFADSVTPAPNQFSICAADYTSAMVSLRDSIVE